jgi:hypothetical protein
MTCNGSHNHQPIARLKVPPVCADCIKRSSLNGTFEGRERPALNGRELQGVHILLCTIGGCLDDLEKQPARQFRVPLRSTPTYDGQRSESLALDMTDEEKAEACLIRSMKLSLSQTAESRPSRKTKVPS